MKKYAASVIFFALIVLVYPRIALWLAMNVPFAYWLLTPWGTPLPSALAILLAAFAYQQHRASELKGVLKAVVLIVASCLGLIWISFYGWVLFVQTRGGL